MAVNVKMGVDLSGFNSGIREGQNILKGLNAEMKATEAEFKATGNSEQMLTNKTKTLNSQLQVQKGIADQAKQALAQLDAAGVKPTDAAYQKLYATLMNAQAGMNEAQAALNALDGSQQQAAKSADGLATSVNSIGKKISLDQVLSGINSIESGLERAAQKAVQLGETIWNNVMDSAKWADDTATQALMYGIDIDTFQRMQKLVVNGLDTTVDAMLTAQSKLKKGIGAGNPQVMQYMQDLSLMYETGKGAMSFVTEDSVDLFFRAGQAIMHMGDAYDKEAAAQALFGKGWKELVPLFDTENGGFASVEEYNQALKDVQVNSEEDVKALAELNDKVGELKGNFDTLSREMMAQLAPALTDAATALNGLLESVLEYLETPEGKEMLKSLGDSVSELFSGMKNINAEDVVNGFKDAFDKVMDVLNWIVNNKDTVVAALEGIFGFWATLGISNGVLNIIKVIEGIKSLAGIGGGETAAATASGGGIMAAISNGLANIMPGIANFVSTNGGPVVDWLTHESPLATVFNGMESIGDWWERQKSEFQERADTFGDNWDPNNPDANVIAKLFGRRDENQDAASRLPQGADWRPSYMSGYIPQNQTTAQEIAEEVGTIDLPAEVDAITGADQIAEQIGTVPVPAQLVVTGIQGLSEYGGSGGGGINVLMKKANGLPFVPYDGMLAMLHKGERVMTASENKHYTYNSNNYFGNVNLNNGLEIEALCDSIDRHNRRQRNGYGS